MNKNKQSINILPFEELVALHQAGKLGHYAEQITNTFIAQSQASEECIMRLHRLALKLAAIRAKHPSGLKAYLEINNLLQTCRDEFLDRIQAVTHVNTQKTEHKESTKVLKFAAKPTFKPL